MLWKMAFRNIFRQKRRSLFTALSMIIGFVMLSVTMALSEGGYGNIIKMFTKDHTGHVQIHHKEYLERPGLYRSLVYTKKIEKIITENREIKHAVPRVFSGGLAFIDEKTTGARIVGIQPAQEAKATTILNKVEKGEYLSDHWNPDKKAEVLLSHGMASILKAKVGSELVLISQGADGSIANDLFTVTGIFAKDFDTMDRMNIYMHINKAQEFLVLNNKIHEIALFLDDYLDSTKVAKQLKKNLAGVESTLAVDTWMDVEQTFYRSMEADKSGSWIMNLIIILIVGIGVLNTVLMVILERTREYGILLALGSRPYMLIGMIVVETFILSIISSIIGALLSLLAIWPLKVYGITYPEPVSIGGITIESINGAYVPIAFWMPIVVVISTAVIVSLIPAFKAAHTDPVKAMRTF
ncbi:ABC transporter permease [bacterium]|nr:ABC transporter permease [bacterium]